VALLSNYLENKMIDLIFRGQAYSFPATLYVGLVTSLENAAAGGTEVSGGSYARVAVSSSLANWAGTQSAGSTSASSGTTGTTSNNNAITFPTPTAAWGSIVGMGIWDAATGGNLLMFGPLAASKSVNNGDPAPVFNAGALAFTLT
jgi:hypothetical protein